MVIGVVLSLVWLIYVATSPAIPLLGRQPGTQVFRDADEHPGDETFDGLIVLRLDFGLSFATAEALDERVRELSTPSRVRAPSSSTSPAWTSSTPRARRSWARSTEFTDASDVTLRLARVKPHDPRDDRQPTACSTRSAKRTSTATSTRRSRPSSTRAQPVRRNSAEQAPTTAPTTTSPG